MEYCRLELELHVGIYMYSLAVHDKETDSASLYTHVTFNCTGHSSMLPSFDLFQLHAVPTPYSIKYYTPLPFPSFQS